MTHKGNIRCGTCFHIVPLPVDPSTEFVHHRKVSFTCPRCGASEVLTGYRPLTRRCFDCPETATGRFWGYVDGRDVFSCECPRGHIHHVYRAAFGPTADMYDLTSPETAALDARRERWLDMDSAVNTTRSERQVRDLLKKTVLGSAKGVPLATLSEECDLEPFVVETIMDSIMAREGDVYMSRNPYTNEPYYSKV